MVRLIIVACLFALAGCRTSSTPDSSVYEVTDSHTERVAVVSAIIAKHVAIPTAILDAYFVEEQIGDGELGPSDYRAFYAVEVAPQEISQWTQLLTPLDMRPQYVAPAQLRDWWVPRDTFTSLQFYQPDLLTGRIHGWIGISQQTGRMYIFTFTM